MLRHRRVAIRCMVWAVLLVALLGAGNFAAAQGPSTPTREPITLENAERVTELTRFGNGWVGDVAWSPDGETLALAGALGVWLYDANDLAAEPRLLEGEERWCVSVAWSPDGAYLLAGGAEQTYQWHVQDGAFELIKETDGLCRNLAWSLDSTQWAMSYDNSMILVMDGQTGEVNYYIDCIALPLAITWSPDGGLLATGDWDGAVRIWDTLSDNLLASHLQGALEGHTLPLNSVAWSPDGTLIASGSRDGTIRIWGVPPQ